MNRRNLWLGLTVALAMATATPGRGEVVKTIDGGRLEVTRYEVEGDWVRLYLVGNGVLLMPRARIESLVDGEGKLLDLGRPPDIGGMRFGSAARVPRTRYGDLIYATARRFDVNPALVAAIVRAESGFNPRAVSPKGARGLMQVMPDTARRFGASPGRLFEPAANLEVGTRYLAWLMDRFPGDLTRVLAAYNAGELNVDRHDGVPPFRETRDYIGRVYGFLGSAR